MMVCGIALMIRKTKAMSTPSFNVSITATVHEQDAPLDDVIAFFQASEIRPWRHFDETIAFVSLTVGFDNSPKSHSEGIVQMMIGYQHEADMLADEEVLDAFCEACPDCDIEITSQVLLAAYTSKANLLKDI